MIASLAKADVNQRATRILLTAHHPGDTILTPSLWPRRSIQSALALLAAGLLDQLVLYTFPLVLGRGKRLFSDGTPPGTLKLVDHKVSSGGVVIATYEPAGPVQQGSFGQIDSAREQERQRRMKEGTW